MRTTKSQLAIVRPVDVQGRTPDIHEGTVKTAPFPLWKRAMDLAIAGPAVVFLAPLLVITAALVCLDGGPPIFAHRRIGEHGRTFACLKFRTMFVDAKERLAEHLAENAEARLEWDRSQKLRRDPRVTRMGAFLRASSIDELPQLINVLRGEMSIVGPRPIVEAEIWRYGHRFQAYCSARPGITGLWQVSGRSDLSYRRRIALDMAYIRRRSPRLDLIIIQRTIPAILGSKGSY
jgi:lipopolysaccharide/colanic/teichoic acid biosynthesis glycosyltransferase